SLGIMSVLLVTACSQATAGWTYAPAPSKAPAASASAGPGGSPAASNGASPGTSPAPGGSPTSQPSPGGTGQLVVVNISAANIKYDQSEVTAPPNTPFQILFANNDAGVPHNVSLHTGGAQGPEIFKGTVFNGVETRPYDIQALDAGQYAFVCSVH